MLREIKKQFMAYRNGIVADMLRAAGMDCYHIIFGLNLPQLSAIARELVFAQTPEQLRLTADALWADKGVRESRLLAMSLYGALQLTSDEALRLMQEIQTREEAEILCLRVLRSHPQAAELAEGIIPDTPLQAHLQQVLARHLA